MIILEKHTPLQEFKVAIGVFFMVGQLRLFYQTERQMLLAFQHTQAQAKLKSVNSKTKTNEAMALVVYGDTPRARA